MTVDTNEQPHIERGHQLPAHGSDSHRRKVLWIIIGIVLLLAVVLAVIWRHHDAAKKLAPAAPKITVTTATAKKGDIGVYLDSIGTVTPVYT
ncbi:MAG: efflux RND transporter periplasmic adaptor subunit, partial [Candidatus Sulfotelmatobacter sp.]